MEASDQLATPASSLVVKLRYQPLCAQCTDMLPRWRGLPGGVMGSWKWGIAKLKNDSAACHCCRFLLQVLDASTWIRYQENDVLKICLDDIGYSQISSQDEPCVQRKSYYRPKLRVFSTEKPYRFQRGFVFVLPAAQGPIGTSHEISDDTFFGRLLAPMVDLSLVKGWFTTCLSRHGPGKPNMISHGCRPDLPPLIQGFRLVDVDRRCIVRADIPVEYAALSYVWGKAKRLFLSKDTEHWLSSPGALSEDANTVPSTFQDALRVAEALGIPYVWIDSLCIDQGNTDEMMKHMNSMDSIYRAAVLTIVSDTKSADSGIPGISLPRGPPQARFQHGEACYLGATKTFGVALKASHWEERAWCLQEKLFSKRLLIFTETQTFYHCTAATWFEDTIMEQKDSITGAVYMREKTSGWRKDDFHIRDPYIHNVVYGTYQMFFEETNFWDLVQSYSQRKMSFESDVIRAFGGILRSVESEHGSALWGIPQYHFMRGLSWTSAPKMNLRREGFPSWTWVGWCARNLRFIDCKRKDTDLRVIDGQYCVSRCQGSGHSVWNLQWYYYAPTGDGDDMRLEPVILQPQDEEAGHKTSATEDEGNRPLSPKGLLFSGSGDTQYKDRELCGLPGRPEEEVHAANFPALNTGPNRPPLSHILRFYTSVATVYISSDPDPKLSYWEYNYYGLCVPGTDNRVAFVDLDREWSGIGKEQTLIYISRCANAYHMNRELEENDNDDPDQESLNLLLIESVQGWGEVKRRVQLVTRISISSWRKLKPRWELVSLA